MGIHLAAVRRATFALGVLLAAGAAAAQPTVPAGEAVVLNPSARWYSVDVFYALLAAGVVGMIGTIAFILGVYLGFIFRGSRREVLKYFYRPPLSDSPDGPVVIVYLALYTIMGGLIAAVFQWAQGEVFAPIQALVLGATWPSVVIRVMAQGGESGSDQPPIPPKATPSPTPAPGTPSAAPGPREASIGTAGPDDGVRSPASTGTDG